MTFINPAVVDGARIAMRQATETALVLASATTNPSLSSSSPTSAAPTVASPTTSSASPTDTSTLVNGGSNSGNGGGNGSNSNGSSNSSSLLFFVALGFGVVFTNLWIIVGVKYCFRYNARNRQLRTENGEPINMENMPRPHRRRREKKLMPIDEVNEKFPMLKYKTWVASRAQEGLPTRGGVSAPASRPSSIRNADGVAPELPSKERMSTDDRPTTSATAAATRTVSESPVTETDAPTNTLPEAPTNSESQSAQHAPKESASSTVGGVPRTSLDAADLEPETTIAQKHLSQASHDEEDEEDEHIDAALPPECLGTSGDTCAICIDTLEDDDDVRGLTCGHAFHAVCIDPWLTTRRACCPLCKADYYTPKQRPQAAEGGDGVAGVITVALPADARNNNRMNLPRRPRHAFVGLGRLGRRATNQDASGRQRTATDSSRQGDGRRSFFFGRQRSRNSSEPVPASPAAAGQAGAGGFFSSLLRPAYPAFMAGRYRRNPAATDAVASGANPAATPSQLEAGAGGLQS